MFGGRLLLRPTRSARSREVSTNTESSQGMPTPLRVIRPVVPLRMLLLILLLVGILAAVPATLAGLLAAMADVPFGWVMLLVWIPLVIGYFVRLKLGQRESRYTLYPDRLVGRFPHPRKLRVEMKEESFRPSELVHLERRAQAFWLRQSEGVPTRIDVPTAQEADGFWQDLLAWRASQGGLYSFSEAEGQVRYSSEPAVQELLGGAPGPLTVRVDRDSPFLHRIHGPGLELRLEDLGGPGEPLEVRWPSGFPLRISNPVSGASSQGTISTREGLLLGSWRRLDSGQADLMLAGRRFELNHELLAEEGVGIAELTYSFGYLQSVRFLAEAPSTALLISLLVLLPSVTFRPRRGTVRAEPTAG